MKETARQLEQVKDYLKQACETLEEEAKAKDRLDDIFEILFTENGEVTENKEWDKDTLADIAEILYSVPEYAEKLSKART